MIQTFHLNVSQLNLTPKNSSQAKLIANPSGGLSMSANKSDTQRISNISKVSNAKIESLIVNLSNQLNDNTKRLNENTIVISNLKKSVDSVHGTLTNPDKSRENQIRVGVPSKQSFARILAGTQIPNNTHTHDLSTPIRPKLTTKTTQNSAKIEEAKIKIAMKNRALKHGTSTVEMHGLGKPVPVIERQNVPKIVWKSIYVSRMSTDVTCDQIVNHIKSNVPDIDEKSFKVHMLVKKDQPLDKLSYISFRVACVESLYSKLCDPSFWPSHVLIGDFVERPRKTKMADFLNFPELIQRKHSNNTLEENAKENSTVEIARNRTETSENNNETFTNETTTDPLDLSVELMTSEPKNE